MGEAIVVLGLIIIGVSYYLLFKEHHKRNEMTFSEIYPLVIEYLVMCIISGILLVVAINCIITGYTYTDEIKEVIKELAIGFSIIILVIIHFIFWVKKHRIDLDKSEREAEEKRTADIAEWIELIVFIAMIIAAIFNIIKYVQFIDVTEKIKQIVGSILIIIASIVLLYNLNPLGIKDKIKSKFKSKK